MSYNRYEKFKENGKNLIFPNITIDRLSTDLFLVFDKSSMRLDNLSYKYYGDPNFAWLIMLANPKLGSLEFAIPDKATLRIPYPLTMALNLYEKKVQQYFKSLGKY